MIYYSEIQHELNRKNDDPEWDEQGKPISNARPAWSYRGSRRNIDRLRARAHSLKEERFKLGLTRRELDRQRWEHTTQIPKAKIKNFVPSARSYDGKRLHEIRCRNGIGRPPKEKQYGN